MPESFHVAENLDGPLIEAEDRGHQARYLTGVRIVRTLLRMTPTLGAILRAEREKRGLSIRELSAAIGCDKSSIVDWEHDRRSPGPEYIAKLADQLGNAFRGPLFPATPEHMRLRLQAISEADWLAELREIYEFQRSLLAQLHHLSLTSDLGALEQEAAAFARWAQLWGHDLTTSGYPGAVTYRLARNANGDRIWVSNVLEKLAQGVTLAEAIAGWTPEERAEAGRVFRQALGILATWERRDRTRRAQRMLDATSAAPAEGDRA